MFRLLFVHLRDYCLQGSSGNRVFFRYFLTETVRCERVFTRQ